jgi:hypothetical protein
LQRWLGLVSSSPEVEPDIVSGYFDGTDAGIALLGLLVEATDFEPSSPVADLLDLRDEAAYAVANPGDYFMNRIRELSELLADPADACSDPTNQVAKSSKDLIKALGILDNNAAPRAIDDRNLRELLRIAQVTGLPAKAVTYFQPLILALTTAFRSGRQLFRIVRLGLHLNEGLREARKARRAGASKGRALLAGITPTLQEKVEDYLISAAGGRLLEALRAKYDAGRVGSHSLLAKDEPESIHFIDAMKLAAFVDAYVTRLLVRRRERGRPTSGSLAANVETVLRSPARRS